ncbi:MAG: hypothetical protein IT428_06985 [Planctomycetaceae bacterium]|nr:hypothetical protein [Planctomycetaceae bacterium]
MLQLDVLPDWSEPSPPPHQRVEAIEVRYTVNIRNTGIVTAKDIHVVLSMVPPAIKVEAPYKVEVNKIGKNTSVEFPYSVHPMSTKQVCVIRQNAGVARTVGGREQFTPHLDGVEIIFDVFAADMMPLRLRAVLDDRQIEFRHQVTAVAR